jgi:hypothetical protein
MKGFALRITLAACMVVLGGCRRSDLFIRTLGVHEIKEANITITITTNQVSVSRAILEFRDGTLRQVASASRFITQVRPGWFIYLERPVTSNSTVWLFDGQQCFHDACCPNAVTKAIGASVGSPQ